MSLMPRNQKVPSVGILTIATGPYFDYWKSLYATIERSLFLNSEVTIHLFTDTPERISEIKSSRVRIKTYEIESLGWPDATLLRYRIFSNSSSSFIEDILMYLDADMLVHKDFDPDAAARLESGGIFLVSHPGYWRPSGRNRLIFYMKNPLTFVKDIILLARMGSLGTWETRKNSQAFTSRDKRKNYVCGGTWLGERTAMISLISSLRDQVDKDLSSGITAIWHDESHLNSWASKNPFELLPPKYCYDFSYPWLRGMSPVIEAVTKENLAPSRILHG
jgi:hypothetical protein